MSKNGKDNRPYLPPVTRIELSEKNILPRVILIAVLIAIAVVSIGSGINQLVNVQPGWNAIEVNSGQPNYSREFTLMYDFSESGGDAAAANKALIGLYTTAMEDSYLIFSKDAESEAVINLYDVNRHVNEELVIHEALYDALELLKQYENRSIYLAPVYVEYNRVFNAESDGEAEQYDPARNPEVMAYIQQLIPFISDENHIDIQLLGENRIKLIVSEDYLAYAQEQGIEEFLDFGWMRNAFVADYTASKLMEQGFTHGYLASYDGFNRTLEVNNQKLDINIYDRQGSGIYVPAKMSYTGPKAIVFLRDYPLRDLDRWSYRAYEDGKLVSSLIDPMDGMCKSALPNLVSYSESMGCAELMLEMVPAFMSDDFDQNAVMALMQKEIYSVWCQNGTVYANDGTIELELLANEGGILYHKQNVK